MNFVNPLFFIGALAAAVPVILHLIKRERSQKVEFPTLMFLRRISKKTIRFQKLRHLLLLLLRVLAFLFLALAFTRPFREITPAAASGGKVTRAHLILLDNSLSMAYGERWEQARRAAAEIARSTEPGDKVALFEFSDRTSSLTQLMSDSSSMIALLDSGVALSDRPTRYGQALRIAEKMALDADTGERIIHLISDFQKNGWAGEEQDFRLGSGVKLEKVDVGSPEFSNLAIGDVRVEEIEPNEGAGLRIKSSVVNYGNEDRKGVRVSLSVDGKVTSDLRADIDKGSVQAAEFRLPSLAEGPHAVVLEVEDSRLTRDNRFSLMIESRGKKPVLAVENPGSGRGGRSPSFFLMHAMNVSGFSPYRLTTVSPQRFESTNVPPGGLVIWNNLPGATESLQARLREVVKRGGGLIIVLGDSSNAPEFNRTFGSWLPVRVEPSSPRPSRRPNEDFVLLTDLNIDHPVFAPFREPHSGTFSTARFFKHVKLSVREEAVVLARFDNGEPALVSVFSGEGRVLIFASSADDAGNDLPLKSVFAPFWQQMLRFLEDFREARHWVEVGDAIEPRAILAESALRQGKGGMDLRQSFAVVDPDRKRLDLPPGSDVVEVGKAGFYDIRMANLNTMIAANPVPRESDLAHGDADQMIAGWLSPDTGAPPVVSADERLTAEEQDRRQRIWRFLLLGFLLFLMAEGWIANRTLLKQD